MLISATPINASNEVELGARLFTDPELSISGTMSCATCHQPDHHYTDQRKLAIGVNGDLLARNTPTLYNSGRAASLGWDTNGTGSLEAQHRIPLFAVNPPEMGSSPAHLTTVLESYAAEITAIYDVQPMDLDADRAEQIVTSALAAFVRSLSHPANGFDAYLFNDDQSALGAAARRGLDLFTSPRLGCSNCHRGIRFGGPDHPEPPRFHVTQVAGSQLQIRTPTLRAVRHTAPYMHAGQLPNLIAVIEHYEQTPAPEVPDFKLSAQERADLIAFLHSL